VARRAAKIDANQPEIVEALLDNGYRVRSMASAGDGFPDLVVGHDDWSFVRLVEVKNGKRGRLTGDQIKFMDEGWPVDVVRSTFEIQALMQEWRKQHG